MRTEFLDPMIFPLSTFILRDQYSWKFVGSINVSLDPYLTQSWEPTPHLCIKRVASTCS